MKILALNSETKSFAVVDVPQSVSMDGLDGFVKGLGIDKDNSWWVPVEDGCPVSVEFHEFINDQDGLAVKHSFTAGLDKAKLAFACRRKLLAALLDEMESVDAGGRRCTAATAVTTIPVVDDAGVGTMVSVLSCGTLFRLEACALQRTFDGAAFVSCRDPKVKGNLLTFPADILLEEDIRSLTEILHHRCRKG